MNQSAGGQTVALTPGAVLMRGVPIIPGDTVTGRALVIVIAIMTFLACLTAGGALLVVRASYKWRADVLQDVTVQIKPRTGDNGDALVAEAIKIAVHAQGVADVRPYSAAESERLLEPWLGVGLDLKLLPIPRIIVIRMQNQSSEDILPLRKALADSIPQSNLDDHRLWAKRLGDMANSVVVLAVAIFALMISAMSMAIGFATSGAMAGNRDIVEVLHFVGASDSFIADEFETHFRRMGLRGAAMGGLSSIAFFLAASSLSLWSRQSLAGDEIASLFGAFALDLVGYCTLALIGVAVTLLTGFLSRAIVLRTLSALQ
jgi:cell division transport system permease protein